MYRFRVVDMNTKRGTIEIRNPKVPRSDPKKTFTFDTVYDWKWVQVSSCALFFQLLHVLPEDPLIITKEWVDFFQPCAWLCYAKWNLLWFFSKPNRTCLHKGLLYKWAKDCFLPSQLFLFFFTSSSKQRDLYDETFRDLVDNVLQGFNGTIFAYGQTGTGKTFTMQGMSIRCLRKG